VSGDDFEKLLLEVPIPRGFYHTSSTKLAEELKRASDADIPF
jgi:hypothetical protein